LALLREPFGLRPDRYFPIENGPFLDPSRRVGPALRFPFSFYPSAKPIDVAILFSYEARSVETGVVVDHVFVAKTVFAKALSGDPATDINCSDFCRKTGSLRLAKSWNTVLFT
jgi:hypothetical protein